ncbi:hypothetical protein CWI37_1445p0010 [Hamiltosporidium tvaerminnensis]|uniref:Uncharacterized protein n=1 Tax=Hamiltosporidium tvaerminnensis TaxID=1176355 RepID=A0A4Q9KW85_9MICR|nr:hypothetical protein CWI37_1445p0010 [Hamiltosporidium tvaerminnensis]
MFCNTSRKKNKNPPNTSRQRNKTVKESKKKNKAEYVVLQTDIVIYNDEKSFMYTKISDYNKNLELLEEYFLRILNDYLTEDKMETDYKPKLIKIVAECDDIADSERRYEELFKRIVDFTKKAIMGTEKKFLHKYKDDETRKEFFKQLFEVTVEKNTNHLSPYYRDKEFSSISLAKMNTTKIDPTETLQKAIEKPDSLEFYNYFSNLLLQSFSELMLNLIYNFRNFGDLYEFLINNDTKNLELKRSSLEKGNYIFEKSQTHTENYYKLFFRDLDYKVISKSKYYKGSKHFQENSEDDGIYHQKIIQTPLDKFFNFSDEDMENFSINIDDSKNLITSAESKTQKAGNCSPKDKDIRQKFTDFLNKLKILNIEKSDSPPNIYYILDLKGIYYEMMTNITNEVLLKIDKFKKEKCEYPNKPITHELYNELAKKHVESAKFSFQEQKLSGFLEKIDIFLKIYYKDFNLIVIPSYEFIFESNRGNEFRNKFYDQFINNKEADEIKSNLMLVDSNYFEMIDAKILKFFDEFFKTKPSCSEMRRWKPPKGRVELKTENFIIK